MLSEPWFSADFFQDGVCKLNLHQIFLLVALDLKLTWSLKTQKILEGKSFIGSIFFFIIWGGINLTPFIILYDYIYIHTILYFRGYCFAYLCALRWEHMVSILVSNHRLIFLASQQLKSDYIIHWFIR